MTSAQSSHARGPEASEDFARSQLRVEYVAAGAASGRPGLLAAVGFGVEPMPVDAPLSIQVRLEPREAVVECWHANGPVSTGQSGAIRYASDSQQLLGVCELNEREHGGVSAAAELIYAQMRNFMRGSDFPHLLRIWNYMDAINSGEGDQERYRQFCVGRLRGLGDIAEADFPAASALGHQHATGRLQVYWLASRHPGVHIENPRQVSAYRYPRSHGPVGPSFARATLALDGTLLISGTASIVGHLSQHADDPLAQVDEIARNLNSLGADGSDTPKDHLIKAYVRNGAHMDAIIERVRTAFPHCPALFLGADICRRELLLEIELLRLAG